MDIAFSYDLDWDDYLDSQMTHNRHSEAVKRGIRKTRTGMLSFYVFVLLVLYPALASPVRAIVLCAVFALGAAHIALVPKLYELRVARLSRRLIKRASSDKAIGPKKLVVKDGQVSCKAKSGTIRIEIAAVTELLESERNFFVFFGEAAPVIFPKEAEGDREGPRSVFELLKEQKAAYEAEADTKAEAGSAPV
ncbi:MAG: hypothetical protein JNG85_11650 [Spirochaetaceae bacterium]|nr:hypothetical protein [Spirochaetaceae bacterium]